MRSLLPCIPFILVCLSTTLNAALDHPIKICGIRVSFLEDDLASTTGNGQFLTESQGIDCDKYTIDGPPHDRSYFESQLAAVNAYFHSVSYGKFGIDLDASHIYPSGQNSSYLLEQYMNYYNPYNEYELQEERLTELFRDASQKAYSQDDIDFSNYDVVVVFHAGIGQDFSLPFLDPTPEDIPSTFIDNSMIVEHLGVSSIDLGENMIKQGIILPESQNHLLFDISEAMFSDASEPCEYQYGMTGTFVLMIGFAVGLPPLWNINTGESGVGVFGLMDQGSNNGRGIIPAPPTAWSRINAGWEEPVHGKAGDHMQLAARSEGHVVNIPIRQDEYFLIENRNNSVRNDISIDSIRYLMGQNSSTGSYPPYIEILQDSTGIVKDSNGVVAFVPNYDLGLPASGLLIWHIDEDVISLSIDDYEINSDLSNPGIDLEEADGAQDIGYPSIFLFNDPSSGYFGDMWFRGNKQYELANPGYQGLKPEFGPNTYPSTHANDGSSTFIKIAEISMARDTMSFMVDNSHISEGFPDTSFHFITLFDIDRDGENDVLGGVDSLYLSLMGDSINERHYFHNLLTNEFFVSFITNDDHTEIDVIEYFQDSCFHSIYSFDLSSSELILNEQSWIDSLVFPIISHQDQSMHWKSSSLWDNHKRRVFSTPHNFGIDLGSKGITVDKFGNPETKWNSINFQYIAGIDLDLDANCDLLAVDSSGILYAFNSDLILMPGFPHSSLVMPPVLAQDLMGTDSPEIVARSVDMEFLYIFDAQGNIIHKITMGDDQLIGLGEYDGKSSIFTSSIVYQFDAWSDKKGNTWSFYHGDAGRSRTINLDYNFNPLSNNMLTRSYSYPNPIRDQMGTLRVETVSAKSINVMVYDLAGYFIRSFTASQNEEGNQVTEWVWDVAELESGVYFAHVEASNNENIETSIIKVAVIH